MEEMIQELSDKVWANPQFHKALSEIELAWLNNELRLSPKMESDKALAIKAMSAAAILACSTADQQRAAAYKIATCVYDLFHESDLPFDAALRVVLIRLGNFPATRTKTDVMQARQALPWRLAEEEIFAADQRTVRIHAEEVELTNFQHSLWD